MQREKVEERTNRPPKKEACRRIREWGVGVGVGVGVGGGGQRQCLADEDKYCRRVSNHKEKM